MRRALQYLLMGLLAGPGQVLADEGAPFDATQLMTDFALIRWQRVKNVNAVCQKQSKARGMGGFAHPVEACAFWSKKPFVNLCTIYTSRRTTMDTVGHEVRHCFQGDFHP
jgi:hypothetical protein